ncbi:hypothetical protein HBH98_077040 [Parastagonospora nodorum]|nr:hypothetical protein HBH51_208520 [Parastagonospora nodorum]KAH4299589.1 hypothetical protein HBI01_116500 [Parastagonospora nodorum]KAH4303797.1 hypothetical protein HBI02_129640 [Parastagonospora nodorum]KAH4329541.1 hypothetical protein HBI00_091600 [Parastagonospora nodorum]KAH4348166.1 hypothetical protein HBH98_077040 [Parastagonospora nodorum]
MSPGILLNDWEGSTPSPSGSNYQFDDAPTLNTDGAEPIAIIGMGCRFPGGSETPEQFWEMLLENRKCYSEPPISRYNINGHYANSSRPGSLKSRGAYFLSDTIYNFDPLFFAVTPAEAAAMDPQQRKLMECIFEAFENGGIPLGKISGTNTGVYVGNFNNDYNIMGLKDGDHPRPYGMMGAGVTLLSNRVNYFYNLLGPSVTIDTACSSSVYAAHQACRALVSGEIDGAIVGGTNLIQAVENHLGTQEMGVLSPTSTCHTFDAAADGYGRGEGIGAIYLKRLSSAVRDGDPIRGVIRATATNANGRTSGVSHPSVAGQEAVIRAAYNFAGITDFGETGYFETHGTGTAVGDPIEVKALSNVFLPDRTHRDEFLIGGVKPNIGHAEAASGIASIIKAAYALETGIIPATIGIKNFNPAIDFRDGKVHVVQDNQNWPSGYDVRRISINSFGYGGANGHVIMESVDSILPGHQSFKKRGADRQDTASDLETGEMGSDGVVFKTKTRTQFLFPFSAHDVTTLNANIDSLRQVSEDYDVEDIAFTLTSRRSRFSNRTFCIVNKHSVMDDLTDNMIRPDKRGEGTNIAMVFTGQGAQNAQMGMELMQDFPSYLRTIRELDSTLQSLGQSAPSWTIERELLKSKAESSIDQVRLSQPLCTAVQIGLVDLLNGWGIRPSATVGHSSGAIAAAYAAGSISKKDAILTAYFRGLAVEGLATKGTMVAVGLGAAEVEPYLEPGVQIACYNSPQSVTLSGDDEPAARISAKLHRDKVFVRALRTNGRAYHSHHMAAVGDEYMHSMIAAMGSYAATKDNRLNDFGQIVYASSVFGKVMGNGFVPSPDYWKQNLESPVLFTQAVESLLMDVKLKLNTIIEIGPHSALEGPIRHIRDKLNRNAKELDYMASLVRGENATTRLLSVAGRLFVKGYNVDLEAVNAIERNEGDIIKRVVGKPLVDLPRYNWNYKKGTNLRAENRLNAEYRLRKFPRHDLLGARVVGTIRSQMQWRNLLDVSDLPWLEHHCLGPQPVLPGMAYPCIAVEAARQFFSEFRPLEGNFCYVIPQLTVKAPLNLPPTGTTIEIMTSMQFQQLSNSSLSRSVASWNIQTYAKGLWTDVAFGTIKITEDQLELPLLFDEATVQEHKDTQIWYDRFASVSLNYGPAFRGLSDLRVSPSRNTTTALTKLLPVGANPNDTAYLVHPATLDTGVQAVLIAQSQGSPKNMKQSHLPVSMVNVTFWSYSGGQILSARPEEGRLLARGERTSLRQINTGFQLLDLNGKPLFSLESMDMIAYAEAPSSVSNNDRHPSMRILWKPDVDCINGNLPDNIFEGLCTKWALASGPSAGEEALDPFFTRTLDLVAHKQSGLNIALFARSSTDVATIIEKNLGGKSSLKRYRTLVVMVSDDDDLPILTETCKEFRQVSVRKWSVEEDAKFDLIALPQASSIPDPVGLLTTLKKNIIPDGRLLISNGHHVEGDMARPVLGATAAYPSAPMPYNYSPFELWTRSLQEQDISTDITQSTSSGWTILSAKPKVDVKVSNVIILSRHGGSEAAKTFGSAFTNASVAVTYTDLNNPNFVPTTDALYVSVVEFGENIFNSLCATELKTLQLIAATASTVFWTTTGNLLAGANPHAAAVLGLSRVLQSEYPRLHFITIDLDHENIELGAAQTLDIIGAFDPKSGYQDTEYIIQDGIRHVSRLSEDRTLDDLYMTKARKELVQKPVDSEQPVRLAIDKVGLFDTLHFVPYSLDTTLEEGEAEVEVKSTSLNMKEWATFRGHYHSTSLCQEGCGVVRRISPGISNVAVGDRVCWVYPGEFSNIRRIPAELILKIPEADTFEQVVGLPLAFCTAVYGLIHLGRLRRGEKVLIHSATGGVGLAAIQIAKLLQAEIFVTVSTDAKRSFLVKHHGIRQDHIYSSKDTSFASGILTVTNGYGIDVCLNSLVGERLRVSWSIMAVDGRFVEIGRHDILDHGNLDLNVFSRNTSFSAFDLSHPAKQSIIPQLMAKVLQFYQDGMITPHMPLHQYSAGDIATAFEHFGDADRMGKVVVSFDKKPIEVSTSDEYTMPGVADANQVLPKTVTARFRSDGTYLLAGCLGGLGRVISRWLIDNGARNLTFIGRSGAESKEASAFVADLRDLNIVVHVIRGDVSVKEDVERAVAASGLPVLGTIQAAMAVQDTPFGELDINKWNYALKPKVQGTINLHEALMEQPLDFFVMLSSVSAIAGTPTQSSYCAANTFLDFFARHRRQQGLPATTIVLPAIPEVGFLSQIQRVTDNLNSHGINDINEEEFIDLMSIAFLPSPKPSWIGDESADSLLVTGWEPTKTSVDIEASQPRYWRNPRVSLALASPEDNVLSSGNKAQSDSPTYDHQSVLEAVLNKFSKVYSIDIGDIDDIKPLVEFGMDSMTGIALRNWVYATFGL